MSRLALVPTKQPLKMSGPDLWEGDAAVQASLINQICFMCGKEASIAFEGDHWCTECWRHKTPTDSRRKCFDFGRNASYIFESVKLRTKYDLKKAKRLGITVFALCLSCLRQRVHYKSMSEGRFL